MGKIIPEASFNWNMYHYGKLSDTNFKLSFALENVIFIAKNYLKMICLSYLTDIHPSNVCVMLNFQ